MAGSSLVRRFRVAFSSAAACSVALSGCLVSFNDYRLGPGPDPGVGGSSSGGAAGGSAGTAAGNDTGGSANLGGGGGSDEPDGESGSAGLVDDEALIDDFEDGNEHILERGGRRGFWFSRNDGSGWQDPPAGGNVVPSEMAEGREASRHAIHVRGGDTATWGGFVRTDFNVRFGDTESYDASQYSGIKLWARSGDAETFTVRLQVATPGTESGCTPCGDHLGTSIVVTPEWQEFTLAFDDVSQAGWGNPDVAVLDTTQLRGFQVYYAGGLDFDLWLDDVRFY